MKSRFFHFTCKDKHIKWVEDLLLQEGYEFVSVPFFEKGRMLKYEAKPLGSSLANFFGLIYIHDKASFLPPLYLQVSKGDVVVDMCASPGGKTSLLSQMVGEKGLVLANEPNKRRLQTLRANLQRLNLFNTVTLNYHGEKFPDISGKVDFFLLDVPCSGWGREKVKNFLIWNEANVESLIDLQRRLIKRAFEILAPGGRLVYSTCTTNPKENQEQIFWALSEFEFELVELKEIEGFEYSVNSGFVMVNGARSNSQSFFIAALRKKVSKFHHYIRSGGETFRKTSCLDGVFKDVLDLDMGFVRATGQKVYFVPYKALEFSELNWTGLQLGELRGSDVFLFSNIRVLPDLKNTSSSLVVTDIKELMRIVSGQKLLVKTKTDWVFLYWYELPLGFLKVNRGLGFWSPKVKIKESVR